MTDRVKGFTVTLDQDIRDDEVIIIANAIRSLRHVVSVENSIVTGEDHINRERIRYEMKSKAINFIQSL